MNVGNDEVVALVGAGCRFPGGAEGMDGYWRFLRGGGDAIGEVPASRWDLDRYYHPDPEHPGTMYTRWGGFLPDHDRFDTAFFGIPPREARQMDPQQRLLLEVAWEALEDAGIVPGDLEGTRTAVFTGGLGADYFMLHAREAGIDAIDPWYATGKEASFTSGRLSYLLGLTGPSLSLSTACSSSLVALHLARRSLLAGESDAALVGGVNLLLAPELTVFMCKAGAMSPDGRCKAFDASANGIVRGDGCAVLVLKRLSDALADGDDVLALIRGSAVNHDGRSAGLTVPSALAQEQLLRTALADAGVAPSEVGYVEAHGTATPLGDPIETYALGQVYSEGRPAGAPLLIGSVKTNLGHTDAAAGVAGLLKAVLAARHGEIPPNLHLDTPNPNIDWERWGLKVPTGDGPTPWPGDAAAPRLAGVSAFGLSGTNAHVIVEAPPTPVPPAAGTSAATTGPAARNLVLPVSAQTGQALRQLAEAHRERLASLPAPDGDPAAALASYVATAATRRTHHGRHRLAVTGATAAELADRLAEAVLVPNEEVTDAPRGICLVFSGQGGQWPGMGRGLLQQEPVFRAALQECDALVQKEAGWSVLEELTADEEHTRLAQTEVVQPVIFALQVALAALWRSWGMTVTAVVGHSMGEIAAAHVAGALRLEDAVRIAVHRGRLLQRAAGQGRMAAVSLSEQAVQERLEHTGGRLWIAAVNGPDSTVVAGAPEDVEAFSDAVRAEGRSCRLMPGDHAFHTPGLEPYRRELVELLEGLTPQAAQIPVFATTPAADGALPPEPCSFDAEHWGRNITHPVRFADAVRRLLAAGHRAFVEAGPHPVLAQPLTQCMEEADIDGVQVASMRRSTDDVQTIRTALCTLYGAGLTPDWRAVAPDVPGVNRHLPRYPWQGEPLWFDRSGPEDVPAVRGGAPAARPGRDRAEPPAAVPRPGREELADLVGTLTAQVLGLPEGTPLTRRQGFAELGMDSLGAVELSRLLARALGTRISRVVALDHPTVERLADHLDHLLPQQDIRPEPAAAPRPAAAAPRQATGAPSAGTPAQAGPEPIAVVGVGCRFPGGASGPDGYWRMLQDGVDAIRTVPEDRFGSAELWRGGFLDDVAGFDAPFFRVPPREARVMDPQQRMFLEVAWEALEHAGMPPTGLAGTRTGVFLGMNSTDYAQLVTAHPGNVDAFYGTGNSFTSASGRLSYLLGLQGPSLSVDTACSSSLVAVHLAVRSLRSGESSVALAGGVNLILTDTIHRSTSAMGALAPDGRCKTFDASANGYTRGEGCGVVVLKPLKAALADGDDVLAVILGSAVNQDGASSGLTVPNGPAQEALVRDAMADARVVPDEVGYVEAHGTGTPLGDPIELQALGAALGRDPAPAARRCFVGSVKTNFGHLEAAAGIAGLIKTVLTLRHREIPPHLHFREPSPEIPWDELPFDVATRPVAWQRQGRRLVAGVSAFGFSGTNAHVLLSDAPAPGGAATHSRPAVPGRTAARPLDGVHSLPLSAATRPALQAQAGAYRELLTDPGRAVDVAALTATAALRRSHLEHRLVVAGRDRAELAGRLDAFLQGESGPGVSVGRAGEEPRRGPVFIFSGHGSYWQGMGSDLVRDEAVFRAAVRRCDEEFRSHLGWSVTETLAEGRGVASELEEMFLVFTLQYALVQTWRELGVEPAAVVGHSLGEVAASVSAGALDLGQAAEVLVHRTEVLKELVGRGGMAVVGLGAERAAGELEGLQDRLWVGVVNSHRSTVVSGEQEALAEFEARMRSKNVFFRPVASRIPGHSPLVEPLRTRLVERLDGLTPTAPRVPMYSSVVGGRTDGPLDAAYWGSNLRQPVLFADAVRALIADGHDTFVELSPHPVQLSPVEHELDTAGAENTLLTPSLQRDVDSRLSLLTALGDLAAAGRRVTWRPLHPQGGTLTATPRYPWQHKPYWVEHTAPDTAGFARRTGHPLLARDLTTAGAGQARIVEADVDSATADALGAATAGETLRLPAAAWIEMVLAALAQGREDRVYRLQDMHFPRAVHLTDDSGAVAQLALRSEAGGELAFSLHSRGTDADDAFRPLATGRAQLHHGRPAPAAARGEHVHEAVDEEFAERFAARCNPPSRTVPAAQVLSAWQGEDAVEVETRWAPAALRLICPPNVLETALRLPLLLAGELPGTADSDLCVSRIGSITVHGVPGERVRIGARLTGSGADVGAEVWVTDPDGGLLVEAHDVRLAPAAGRMPSAEERRRVANRLYRTEWRQVPHEDGAGGTGDAKGAGENWLLLADRGGVADALAGLLRARGHTVRVLDVAERDGARGQIAGALRDLGPGPRRRNVVHVNALDLPEHVPTASDLTGTAHTAASLLAAYAAGQSAAAGGGPVRVVCVTRAAQAVDAEEQPAPLHAPVNRLAGVAGVDWPTVWGGAVDLDRSVRSPQEAAERLLAELLGSGPADLVALRADGRLAARIVRRDPPGPVLEPVALRSDRSYLVVGGSSELAERTGRWLTGRGAGAVVSAPLPYESPDALDRVIKEAAESGTPVAGVVWLGVDWHLDPVGTDPLTRDEIETLARDRGLGPWLVHDACLRQGVQTDLFVLFSSVASRWGAAGASRQAVPDALLAALAAHRRRLGLPVHEIAWAPWDEVGLLDEGSRDLLVRSGLEPLSPQAGLELLEHVTADHRAPSVTAADADWSLLLPLMKQSLPTWSLFDEIQATAGETAQATGEFLDTLRAASPEVRDELFLDCVMEEVSVVVGLDDPADLEPRRGFFEMGMSSITTLELRVRLERRFGCRLPATLAFDFPTSEAVARHLATEVLGPAPGTDPAAGDTPAEGTADQAPTTTGEPSGVPSDPAFATYSDDDLLALLDEEITAAGDLLGPESAAGSDDI